MWYPTFYVLQDWNMLSGISQSFKYWIQTAIMTRWQIILRNWKAQREPPYQHWVIEFRKVAAHEKNVIWCRMWKTWVLLDFFFSFSFVILFLVKAVRVTLYGVWPLLLSMLGGDKGAFELSSVVWLWNRNTAAKWQEAIWCALLFRHFSCMKQTEMSTD